jgi:resuscitation-promoting factor RpfA
VSGALEKSPEAFRTISEAADAVGVPTHVLRFWESRFPQVKPVKRAGGRRYYRPADVDVLMQIRKLLHEDGMTIRGARKLLRTGSSPLPEVTLAPEPPAAPRLTLSEAPMAVDVEPEPEPQARILSFSRRAPELLPEPDPELEPEPAPEPELQAEPAVSAASEPDSSYADPASDPHQHRRYRLKGDADWSKVGQLVERLEALSIRLNGQG